VSEREQTDVLVIGLGPAGSRAAALAAAGHEVIALDRRREAGIPVQCAEFVPTLLDQELDGLSDVTHQQVREMMTFVEDEAPDVKTDFPGRMIDRAKFDAALVGLAEEAGARCRFGTAVEAIETDGSVRLSDGRHIQARVLIGADGPRSRAGRALGRVNTEMVETRQITVALYAAHHTTDIFLSTEIPGGYGWLFPKGEVANLGVGVVPEAKDRLKPILDNLHDSLVISKRLGRRVLGHTGGPIPVGGMLDPVGRLEQTPVLLAGDAAGLANPVTGAGISAAVISGGLAGAAAAALLDGDTSALAAYARELENLFKPALDRALVRRREMLARHAEETAPTPEHLRRGWIAYPAHWAA